MMQNDFSFIFSSYESLYPILITFAVLSAMIIFAITKQIKGSAFRLVLAILLTVLALNPKIIEKQKKPLDDIVLILQDNSFSQQILGRDKKTKEIIKILENKLSKLKNTQIKKAKLKNENLNGTFLKGSLQKNLQTIPKNRLSAIFFVSDGNVFDEDIKELSKKIDAPFFVFLTGEKQEYDRYINVVKKQNYSIIGKNAKITFRLEDNDKDNNNDKSTPFYVYQNKELVASARLNVNEDYEISLPINHAGNNIYELETKTTKDELSKINNKTILSINGIRDRLKVLLVSGRPHAGERTWRNMLKSDPSVDLVQFNILRPRLHLDPTPTKKLALIPFPINQMFIKDIDKFDLIILDNYQKRGILQRTHYKNIVRYVKQGGALFVSLGSEYATQKGLHNSPLNQLIKIKPKNKIIKKPFDIKISKIGKAHPVTRNLKEENFGKWLSRIEPKTKNIEGKTLLETGDKSPLLMLKRIKKGRVSILLSDNVWLWEKGYDKGGPYLSLLKNTIHWLMKEPSLEENRLFIKNKKNGFLVMANITKNKESLEVKVTTPSEKKQTITLSKNNKHIYQTFYEAKEVGIYKFVTDDGLKAVGISGGINNKEISKLSTNSKTLKPILEKTGGRSVFYKKANDFEIRKINYKKNAHGYNWLGIKKNNQFKIAGMKQTSLINIIYIACFLLLGYILCWIYEGRRKI